MVNTDDEKIINLFFERDENAIKQTDEKYGKYLQKVSYNLLKNKEDVEECLNDTYVKAWNSIPPTYPKSLLAYLVKIIRNSSISRLFSESAKKRGKNLTAVLDEIAEIVPDKKISLEDEITIKLSINTFLERLDKNSRIIFVRRYFYAYSIKEIANDLNYTKSNVKVILHRTRKAFKEFLEGEGV